MTAQAVEELEATAHYEVWKRVLGDVEIMKCTNVQFNLSDDALAYALARNKGESSRLAYVRKRKELSGWIGPSVDAQMYYYFVLKVTSVRELV